VMYVATASLRSIKKIIFSSWFYSRTTWIHFSPFQEIILPCAGSVI
jgi:hypothetical protein